MSEPESADRSKEGQDEGRDAVPQMQPDSDLVLAMVVSLFNDIGRALPPGSTVGTEVILLVGGTLLTGELVSARSWWEKQESRAEAGGAGPDVRDDLADAAREIGRRRRPLPARSREHLRARRSSIWRRVHRVSAPDESAGTWTRRTLAERAAGPPPQSGD